VNAAWGGLVLSLSGGTLSRHAKWVGMTMVCVSMASCATTKPEVAVKKTHGKEYFSEKDYGVKASPRLVADGQPVPKGGGRFMVGQPYQVRGKTYVPKEDPKYNKTGLASWYGSAFHGRQTANGEVYDSDHLSAAHPTFPLPSYARVTNLDNGSSVIVRVNDRGPYHAGRIMDVSEKTAEMLDMKRIGTANVNVQYVGRARIDGEDTPFLMASYVRKGDRMPSFRPEGQIATGVMVASNQSFGDQLQSYGSALPMPRSTAERMPSASRPSPAVNQPQQAFAPTSREPLAAPRAADRPVVESVRPRQQMVASAAPAPIQPKLAPVAVQQRPAQVAAQPRPSTQTQTQTQTQPRASQPVQPRFVQPQVQTTETAYVSPPKGRQPQVMFGNMLLEGPVDDQKPVR
jgi:rare lipoprotein A